MLENSDLDSSDEVSELSEFSATSPSTKLTENGSEEDQVDLIYFSSLMARIRKTIRLQEEPGTSGVGSNQGGTEMQRMES